MLLEQTPGLKKISERDIDTRQAADFESALLSYTKGGITSAERIAFNKELSKVLNEVVVVSDGKGGTKNTTIAKDYPVAAQMARELKGNAFGGPTTKPINRKLSTLGSEYWC